MSMKEILARAKELSGSVSEAWQRLSIDDQVAELKKLQAQSRAVDFWQDSDKAQTVMKQISRLESNVNPWLRLKQSVDEVVDMASLDDPALANELQQQFSDAQAQFDSLKRELKFSGKYDKNDVILSIHAGAGGTDAQDWTQMLLRMYVRWAESHDFSVTTLDESAGDEAGIKSVTLDISGRFVFGRLKGEHGVHRLVRLSPFNSDNLRQTSFAKVEVVPKVDTPAEVVIDEKDLKIDVYRSGGRGGQSVNTTDSAVRVTHLPTNIVVAIQNERSQLQNKETALTVLRSRLAQLQTEQHQADLRQLKGPNQSAEWGNQIRSYVLHPYKQVKDLRTRYESSDPEAVLDGELDQFIEAYLEHTLG